EVQTVAADGERRHRVAPGVDGDHEVARSVVRERSLRRETIGLRARERSAAVAAGCKCSGACERTVRSSVVDDDVVSARLVRLDEDETGGARIGRARARRDEGDKERGDDAEQSLLLHGSPLFEGELPT